jgi:hypothetical protein
MFSKTAYFELLKPLPEAKELLGQIAAGAEIVSGQWNQFLANDNNVNLNRIILRSKTSKLSLKTYLVEIRESEGVAWLMVKVSPTIVSILIGFLLLALTVGSFVGLPVPKIAVPLTFVLPYIFYLGFTTDIQAIGTMLDPVYFKSPAAQAAKGKGFMGVLSSFTVPYYIVCILGIVAFFVYYYIKLFT